jgi:hypothetical protein
MEIWLATDSAVWSAELWRDDEVEAMLRAAADPSAPRSESARIVRPLFTIYSIADPEAVVEWIDAAEIVLTDLEGFIFRSPSPGEEVDLSSLEGLTAWVETNETLAQARRRTETR